MPKVDSVNKQENNVTVQRLKILFYLHNNIRLSMALELTTLVFMKYNSWDNELPATKGIGTLPIN